MPDASDMDLLQDYDRHGSEAAFAELVQRHISLVYSVALRHVSIAAQAEEITQAVFIILARKAAGLRPHTILEGWLHETTRLTSLSFRRGERRRQFREQEAYMQSNLQESGDDPAWNRLAPLLDEAVSRLGKKDRDAVMLRFFKEKQLREVAAALQVSEAAAQRRVLRALEKLRKFFANRGVISTTATIAGAISANSVQAAPVALAKTVTAMAIAKGTTATASTLTLLKGSLKLMAWTKAKMAIVVGISVLLAAGTTTVVLEKAGAQMNSILKQRLPDGSLLILNQVSYGDEFKFVHGSKMNSWSWPEHDELVVEFKLVSENPESNPLVNPAFYRQFRCVLRGNAGIEYVEEFPLDNFKKEWGGYYGYVQTSAFPRDSRWLWFQIEKRDDSGHYDSWQTVAEFKISNPATPANLKWIPTPAPATNNVDGMDFVLGKLTVKTVPNYTNDIWNHVVTIPAQVFAGGAVLTNWGATYIHVEDASGNWEYLPRVPAWRSLDPRYVWKLDMDFEPESDFPAESLATINLPNPSTRITTNIMNLPVTISWDGPWIDASIPTNRSDLAIRFISATDNQGEEMRNPSGSWGQYRFREGYFMTRRGDATIMDIKPTKVTLAIVPNVHTTFYAQPRLATE